MNQIIYAEIRCINVNKLESLSGGVSSVEHTVGVELSGIVVVNINKNYCTNLIPKNATINCKCR